MLRPVDAWVINAPIFNDWVNILLPINAWVIHVYPIDYWINILRHITARFKKIHQGLFISMTGS